MTYHFSAYVVVGLFLLTIAGLVKYQAYPERVFGVLLLVLFGFDFVSSEQVVGSMANQGVLTLMLLMICSLALEKTKVLRQIANYVIRPNYARSSMNLFAFSVLSSSVLNNTAVVSNSLRAEFTVLPSVFVSLHTKLYSLSSSGVLQSIQH